MKCRILILCFSAIAFTAGAAPLNKTNIGADAHWVIHLDLEAFRQSKLGTLILTDIQTQFGEKVQAIQELIGSNVLTDFNHFTLYGPDHEEQNAVLLAEGRFNPQKLTALLALNPQYQKSTYRSYTLYRWFAEQQGKNQVGTFARENLIAISQNQESLQQALDVLDGKRPSLSEAPWLNAQGQVPGKPILLAAAGGVKILSTNYPQAAMLTKTEALHLFINENNSSFQISLLLQMPDPQTALQVEQAVLGMKAILTLSQNNASSPQPNENKANQNHIFAGINPSRWLPFLNNCQVSTSQNAVTIRFEMPSETLYELLKQWRSSPEQPGTQPQQQENRTGQ
ncbi:MAG TPA: hypothetical protein PLV55_05770 [Anaerohalosphaeraceae bacterium]|nr:hypothetical protein [Anaerohalosphaeraceae bacterium]HOL88688.1 hypothetical protein [Anaerohalosphaeraceae bacterium]